MTGHDGIAHKPVTLYATCPPYRGGSATAYLAQVSDVAQWSEEAGCEGILVYTDNGLLDPWLVAQVVIQQTRALSPLVAVQPVYMHPYSVAKLVTTLSYLYGRRIDLNMVAGGFKNDLMALHDETPHDQRYARLVEYTRIILDLLAGRGPVTFRGQFHSVTNLTLTPALDRALLPRVTVSGSSEAGLAAARALDALSVKYPAPITQAEAPLAGNGRYGIRVGIVARESEEEAWGVAHARFPADRRGQLTHQLAMKVSDSSWHKQLSETAKQRGAGDDTYWMLPFENYKTFCPYLVGSYDRVAEELARFLATGCDFVILDVPASLEELGRINHVMDRASAVAARA